MKEINTNKQLYIFCDEFTNYNDTETGVHAILLLNALGYRVQMIKHAESGRACISKGLLKKAKRYARENIMAFYGLVDEQNPLVGIEPSAILSFRDEYPVLVGADMNAQASHIAQHTFTFEEFICREHELGHIDASLFDDEALTIHFHGHCHQKALSSVDYSARMLSIPKNKKVHPIDCGCCGMAGSFGFEKEHYALSMAIGELSLFPAIRNADENSPIAASGTSCRAQILDGTGKQALHPIDLLFSMLRDDGANARHFPKRKSARRIG
jgi:Fe-S oxidoreductase